MNETFLLGFYRRGKAHDTFRDTYIGTTASTILLYCPGTTSPCWFSPDGTRTAFSRVREAGSIYTHWEATFLFLEA
jgi:hypothetical protein